MVDMNFCTSGRSPSPAAAIMSVAELGTYVVLGKPGAGAAAAGKPQAIAAAVAAGAGAPKGAGLPAAAAAGAGGKGRPNGLLGAGAAGKRKIGRAHV